MRGDGAELRYVGNNDDCDGLFRRLSTGEEGPTYRPQSKIAVDMRSSLHLYYDCDSANKILRIGLGNGMGMSATYDAFYADFAPGDAPIQGLP